MKDTLKLSNPIKINGTEITEVTHDSNEIDGILFATAESKKKTAAGIKNASISVSAEFDPALHLYLGFAAIVAVNSSFDFSDVERIKGKDIVEVMRIGRNFILMSDQTSAEKDSDERTETTPESTTPEYPTLSESE